MLQAIENGFSAPLVMVSIYCDKTKSADYAVSLDGTIETTSLCLSWDGAF